MNWITNSVLPKIKALVQPREVPENFWTKCPGCGEMIFHRQLEDNLQVCTSCGYHFKLNAKARLTSLFDKDTLTLIELEKQLNSDPLKFRDIKKYSDRLREARTRTSQDDAIVIAEGELNGLEMVAAVFSFEFMGGSMGIAVGNAILKAAELAVSKKAPLIIFPSSGGARMQEGILSLMQLPRTVIATQMVKEAGLPLIVVLTNPTTGGVTASFAMLGDIHIAEPGAIIGFAGQRVITETIREKLPEGFQCAEHLLDHGMVDMVVSRLQIKEKLSSILSILMIPQINK
ncbi:acetyl-CoA carboxylase, carboxyltransferase subunit beta [Rhodospirillaceae bacterium]|jgi:acetyl-CoA carboxylase carboxyl transferase subunit beta|nr:acetyl-CoA carboxylase carboxyltransferase subunit beta [Rhodospirillaceae bacterium]MBT6306670.1 acetyl-CoA carboxylase carboxyltransferase subunit beta [Rhodospirillaceae bacterium]MBT7731782.1 acetyl-CoA carboxylase carboxyltransferase subunit beta [Rhodospirillaceae bacterium]MDC0998255.1 acetyl-CoA carboxylase, carboxyltransferase subunit beta [Alphaproteobacteria bacterium]MDC1442530.1 acetyl-CoA carboxylase, carboxyltransferase subunit beta [Rhodospirillaceae bacterium]